MYTINSTFICYACNAPGNPNSCSKIYSDCWTIASLQSEQNYHTAILILTGIIVKSISAPLHLIFSHWSHCLYSCTFVLLVRFPFYSMLRRDAAASWTRITQYVRKRIATLPCHSPEIYCIVVCLPSVSHNRFAHQ